MDPERVIRVAADTVLSCVITGQPQGVPHTWACITGERAEATNVSAIGLIVTRRQVGNDIAASFDGDPYAGGCLHRTRIIVFAGRCQIP
jgi:hypothetical protein